MPPASRKPTASARPPEPPAPANLLASLIAMAEELAQIMRQEVGLVEGRKSKEHADLLKRKQRLTIDYRAAMKALALQPDILKQAPEEARKAAKAAAQKLSEASDLNAKTLRAAIVAAQRLAQTIIGIIKDEVLPKGGYVNPRTAAFALGTYSPQCRPITVRRTA